MSRRRASPTSPRPFLKWAGGKRSLLPQIMDRLPDGHISTYIEPFVGGGAVFFALARERRFGRAILADRNPELVNTYVQVRDDVEAVLDVMFDWGVPDKAAYYEVRNMDATTLPPAARAGRTIWLNRTCFNGLYRLNRSGKFNVPFGARKLPRIVDVANLRACSEALADVEIVEGCFSETLARAEAGAVVYCDPPYWPVSKTSNFTAYDRLPFGPAEHAALNEAFRALPSRGAVGLLSNSKVDETEALYADLDKDIVFVRRSINRDGKGRGAVPELLVSVG